MTPTTLLSLLLACGAAPTPPDAPPPADAVDAGEVAEATPRPALGPDLPPARPGAPAPQVQGQAAPGAEPPPEPSASDKAIQALLLEHRDEVQACWTSLDAATRGEGGDLVVEVIVAAGRAGALRFLQGGPDVPLLRSCVQAKVAGWSFAGIADGPATFGFRFEGS